jgi:WD40 repeat protein
VAARLPDDDPPAPGPGDVPPHGKGDVTLWDLNTGEAESLPVYDGLPTSVAFRRDGAVLAVKTPGFVRLLAFPGGGQTGQMPAGTELARDFHYTRDGQFLLCRVDNRVNGWDVSLGRSLPGTGRIPADALAVHPDERLVAAPARLDPSEIEQWDTMTWTKTRRVHVPDLRPGETITALAFSPNGTRLAAGTGKGRVKTVSD